MLNLARLNILREVVQRGSFSSAAEALDYALHWRILTELDDHAVPGLAHAHTREFGQCPPEGKQEFTQKELAVPALQPEFVIMDNNDGFEHAF